MSDRERIYNELLALRCRHGDDGAMEELIRHWEKRLFYFIRRLVSNEEDAWDVLQETWLRVIQGIRSLREPDKLAKWLYRIARNSAMGRLRGRYAYAAIVDDQADVSALEAESETFGMEDAEQVHDALGRISLPHREVLTLFFLQDLSIDEIADVLEIAPGTVKSRLHFAKRALRAVLEREEAGL